MRKGFQMVAVLALVGLMVGSSFTVSQAGFFDRFTSTKESTTDVADGAFDESDMAVTINEQVVTLGIDINTILSTLGTPTNKIQAKSCLFDGDDKVFTWNGITVNTYPDATKDIVYLVEITGTEATPSGIKVGDSLASIEKAYGKTYQVEADYVVYYLNDFDTLSFKMVNDKVESIEYYKQY